MSRRFREVERNFDRINESSDPYQSRNWKPSKEAQEGFNRLMGDDWLDDPSHKGGLLSIEDLLAAKEEHEFNTKGGEIHVQ